MTIASLFLAQRVHLHPQIANHIPIMSGFKTQKVKDSSTKVDKVSESAELSQYARSGVRGSDWEQMEAFAQPSHKCTGFLEAPVNF